MSPADGFVICWPVSVGRVYDIACATSLVDGEWTVVYGPATARADQTTMCWTNAPLPATGRFYRVEALLP